MNEFKGLLKKFDEKNLRFFYFRRSNNNSYFRTQGVTVATLLDREKKKLKMGFAFCDTQDNFYKLAGKVAAVKRLIAPDKFYKEVNWTGDSLVDVAIMFNSMDKPVKFHKWKFLFEVFLKANR